jgi:hypothetical protein
MNMYLLGAAVLSAATVTGFSAGKEISFQKVELTPEFWAEGADVGDFNRDGHMDIESGPFWYEGPEFKVRHEIWPATATFQRAKPDGTKETVPGFEGALGTNNAYSDEFLTFAYDFNGDKWTDVIVYGMPGTAVFWYENPKGKPGPWTKHEVFDVLDNESPDFVDITGDGKPEMLCCSKGYIGYAEANWKNPAAPWTFHAVSPKGEYQRFTHGIGAGDINKDGRADIIEKDGWWEQPANSSQGQVWKMHRVKFAPSAAQMLVYDVNGDKLSDVITCVDAHGYGLVWWEQMKSKDGEISFKEHVVLNMDATPNKQGVSFSQVHALALADMDGDGIKDVVTGKRFWAHGPGGDPEPNAPAVLYWFQITRPVKGQAEFIPHLVDDRSGVGTQVTAAKVSNKKHPDIIVGNKRGVFLFKNSGPR